MDAFYASVERLDAPELAGKPVIVGGAGPRSVVSAASYEARRFGVHSAMPMFQARRLCPQGVFLPVRMARYQEVSRQIMAVLRNFSPVVEQASVDEAYLDASGLERIFGPVEELAQKIKLAVLEKTGLTCSVGLAPVKFLAKIASDQKKPDGCTIIHPERVSDFMDKLPLQKIPGIGGKTLEVLHSLGVRGCRDILNLPPEFWQRRLGKMGLEIYRRASGQDERAVEPYTDAKSESAEHTFDEDSADPEFLSAWLMRQAERVGASLRRQDLSGRTITLKVKYADFTQITRSLSLDSPTNSTQTIFDAARGLLEQLLPLRPVRLIGLGISRFGEDSGRPGPEQLSLLPAPEAGRSKKPRDSLKQKALDKALDKARERFGNQAVVRGRVFAPKKDSK